MPTLQEIKEIKIEPMDNIDLKYYLGDSLRLLTYNEMGKYNSIDELLPNDKDYIILLYPVVSEINGHYSMLYRLDNIIYYADSYGLEVDEPLSFSEKFKNTPKKLSHLLDDSSLQIYYNTVCFQNKKNTKISTCGSYSVFFILVMKELNGNLGDAIKLLEELKREKPHLTYDDIVVQFINKR